MNINENDIVDHLNSDLPIYFLGDHHGSYNHIASVIEAGDISNCHIIHAGDGGEGFITDKDKQRDHYRRLNNFFKGRNIFYKSIRGNHSDPYYFGEEKVSLDHFVLVPDYSLFSYKDKTIQMIGGAISIDRKDRILNVSYWSGEGLVLDLDKCRKVDILMTHTAPSFCHPVNFNETVYIFARSDATLLDELVEERKLVDKIFDVCKPELHLYGHFHSSRSEKIGSCTHKLLDINEFWEYRV